MGIKESFRNWRERVQRRIETIALKYQRLYLACICTLALVGYLLILSFPILIMVSISGLISSLINETETNLLMILIHLGIILLSSLLIFRQIQYKPVMPAGISLSADKMPELFSLISDNQKHFKGPKLKQVIITPDYKVDIIKTPRWGFPAWSFNTLSIGLPVLLCFSPKQFECLITGKIGQFTRKRSLFTNWLYQQRSLWQQYALAFSKQKPVDCKILYWLYGAYSSLYSAASVLVARHEELNADSYALEIHNHEYVREMITANGVYYLFLEKNFWPAIHKSMLTKTQSFIKPYRQLAIALRSHLQGKNLEPLSKQAFNMALPWNSTMASLSSRLQNITHDSPSLSERTTMTASSQYLGPAQVAIIDIIDKLWLKQILEKNRKDRKKPRIKL